MHAGVWDKSAVGSHEVRGRKLGIVGYGNIGSQLSVLAETLGMHVYFYDTEDKLALGNARRCATLEELLETVETVTLHVDGRLGNAGIFGAEQFARMRPRSLFLNLSRGFVIDHDALRRHLEVRPHRRRRRRRLPGRAQAPGRRVRLRAARACPTSSSPRTSAARPRRRRPTSVASSAASCATTSALGSTTLSVNLPGLTPTTAPFAQRIAHLHDNNPGVLGCINQRLAEHQINIIGQVLATRGHQGYVVTDTDSPVTPEALTALADLDGTIRMRTLS